MTNHPIRKRRSILKAGLGALALNGLAPNSVAQTSITPAPGMPLLRMPKPVITMDEKVALANHIFIGFGKNIHYVDCKGAKVASIDEACGDKPYARGAIVEIEVIRELYLSFPKRMAIAITGVNGALVPFGRQPAGHDAAVKQFMSGAAIYFGIVQTDKIFENVPNEPLKVVGEITIHRFIPSYAIEGPIDNPLPVSHLPEVVAAIARRVEREKKEAAATPQSGKSRN